MKENLLSVRPNFLDYAKVLVMLLVVMGHYNYYLGLPETGSSAYVRNIIFLFHMPFFFLVSGILHKSNSVKNTIIKDVKSLIVPYIAMGLFCVLVGWLISGDGDSRNLARNLFCLFTGNYSFPNRYLNDYCSAVWFLFSLFEIKIGYQLILSSRKISQMILIGFWVTIVCITMFYRNTYFLLLGVSSVGMIFYAIGERFRNQIIKILSWSTLKLISIFIIMIIITLALGYINNCLLFQKYQISMVMLWWGENPLLFIMAGLSGSLMMLSLSEVIRRVAKISWITYLSSGTIVVLGFHRLFFVCLKGHIESLDIFHDFLISSCVYLACVFTQAILRKYLPFAIGGR